MLLIRADPRWISVIRVPFLLPMTADDVIRLLQLQPHPVEGGYFRETYRASTTVSAHGGNRNVSTAIYYLLKPGHVSELHVLPTDEVFHFYSARP